ncbi:hypothetical protein BCR41DRAFT_414026 [Lobosporangium transversale]|uniref:Major facilitator superfamily domain-containing protein n=1 Tax=Lobosporangium transversale TaxID=64571 RepID=A0A1Y2G6Y2_9FUNG|nr:hypothetical protein BCR41DRAFT_416385 [Lobosporangium transversale]XP_021876716.1 hypothetical protein BCR41DRAFT_414026 [Lobosporangium transversale]ORY95986.1 hypothetical protein BCR41DRAFT_416385 [Lobosporangium transversale]ORZ04719.1 hypothetical protein BCR41DRAFT_414026 [Lobosporangium transversale]|eukprot:XP_021875427.1 hypothetical protein BCR41DRAFT_416385 [Lobosporangium transversale]
MLQCAFNPLRPLLCLRSPTNALLVTFNGLSLAAQFCMNNTMPISFHEVYGMSETTIGLVFCAGGFGSIVGSIVGGRYSDYVMRRWLVKHELRRQRELRDREAMFGAGHGSRPSSSNGSTPVKEITEKDVVIDVTMRAPPEIRLRSVWLGVFLLPLGLMLFGWSIQNRLALGSAVVGIFFVGFGMMMVYSSTTTALVDANSQNNMATSAVACNSLARGVTGAIGGFTALPLLGAMGSGWLYTFWALMTLLGSIGLVVLLVKAKTWREQEAVAEKVVDRV